MISYNNDKLKYHSDQNASIKKHFNINKCNKSIILIIHYKQINLEIPISFHSRRFLLRF